MNTNDTVTPAKKSMFVLANGQNVVFTFILVSSLFLLWGFCNGMIDVMDKHFQQELNLTLAQSAWVQFAHYLGYFLMALPAGWLAIKLGYKGGIIAGLLLVAVGGFWFIPATHIAQFWAFLLGVCLIASGLTFLETVANPYTTVLGDLRYAATRINLAQSCNGIGWIFGPIAGAAFFYGKDSSGASTGSQTIWIPYAGVAVVVIILAIIFYFANVPDVKMEDDYHLDEADPRASHSIWKRPHFVMGVFAQFLYVAAQCGIFSFFINYMTSQVPVIPASLNTGVMKKLTQVNTTIAPKAIQDLPGFVGKLQRPADPVAVFVRSRLSAETLKALDAHQPSAEVPTGLRIALVQDLNKLVEAEAGQKKADNAKPIEPLYTPERFAVVKVSDEAQKFLAQNPEKESRFRLNRMLLRDALPMHLPYQDGLLHISDSGASMLASLGFFCFLLGRFSGAGILKKCSAHKVLGLYGVLSAVVCLAIFFKLGWFSVACVFLSYFFMSIMFPTIFALGIFGLGVGAKKASAFIVMAIMGGAILPKLMGAVGDHYDMSRAFIVPLVCFLYVAFYGFNWSKFSGADSLHSLKTTGGH